MKERMYAAAMDEELLLSFCLLSGLPICFHPGSLFISGCMVHRRCRDFWMATSRSFTMLALTSAG